MKNYLKSITKTIYQKVQRVVQDQYIQPITQLQVYSIINRKRPYSSNINKNQKSIFNQSTTQTQQQILNNIQRLSMITPQRQFKLIGQSYSIQVISYRMKQLKSKIDAVKQYMFNNYPNNLSSIQTALLQLQNIKNLSGTKQKSFSLRNKLSQLQNQVNRTHKITKLNIKLKNIKQTIKLIQKIPNIKQMHLFELKNINLSQINQFKQSIYVLYPLSIDKQLKCIQHLEFFIDKVSSQHLRQIINSITICLSQKFENLQYQKAIKDFIISKSNIDFQKLLIRLVQSEIRDKIQQEINKSSEKNHILLRCKKYIKILINLSKIFRWHRYNLAVLDSSPEIQQKIRARNNSAVSNCSQKSQDKYPMINLDSQSSIKINTEEVRTHTCGLMDQCLKEQVQQILFNDSIKNEAIFQILALVNNFYQIAFSFTSYMFDESKNLIHQILMRKCYKLQEKGLKDFNDALAKDQQSQWNRLPLLKNYRFKSLQRTIQKMKKLHLYDKIPTLTCQNFKFLKIDSNSQNQETFQLQAVQNKQDSFQLNEIEFPYQKIQKTLSYEINDSPLPQHEDPQVVLCKSSLTILSYFEQFLSMYFYFPIEEIRNDILDKMSFYLDYYIYFLFETFLSDMYKKLFFENNQTLEQKYLQVRVKYFYRDIYQFLRNFNQIDKSNQNHNEHQKLNGRKRKVSIQMNKYKSRGCSFIKNQIKPSKVSQQNCVKARVIATDSIKFILAYFSNILNHLQKYTTTQQGESQLKKLQNHLNLNIYIKKIENYKNQYLQLSDLLLTDITPSTTKIDFVLPIMKKIKWHQLQNSKQINQYGSIILKNIRQTYQKMKSMSKGQIPYYLVDKIFSFYWKTQLTFITKIFIEDHVSNKQKGGRASKIAFEKIIDTLYQGLVQFMDQKPKNKQMTSSSKNITQEYAYQRLQVFRSIYLKIKNIFPMLLQGDWQNCKQMVMGSLKNCEFIYKIQISIMKASQSCSGLSINQIQERQQQLDEFIRLQILK